MRIGCELLHSTNGFAEGLVYRPEKGFPEG